MTGREYQEGNIGTAFDCNPVCGATGNIHSGALVTITETLLPSPVPRPARRYGNAPDILCLRVTVNSPDTTNSVPIPVPVITPAVWSLTLAVMYLLPESLLHSI
ncbi:hypothetical protein KCP73_00670 [Salmonella enterica subsp. enterica]|nr:hypothetical protein KCP73_00670 [Salmonella enterica subsp. enterica]